MASAKLTQNNATGRISDALFNERHTFGVKIPKPVNAVPTSETEPKTNLP